MPVVSEEMLLNHPCVIPRDGNDLLRGYWLRVDKGTQESHHHGRKDDMSHYNFLSLEHQPRLRRQLAGREGAGCKGWNVRKGGENMTGHL